MANCKHCGQPVGFMRRHHRECRHKHKFATKKIPEAFTKWMEGDYPAGAFFQGTVRFAQSNFVKEKEFKALTFKGLTSAIDLALADHLLTEKEEEKLASLLNSFKFTINDLPRSDQERLVKCGILRDMDEGRIPERINWQGSLSINFARREKLIWVFENATYFTIRSQTSYAGRSHGVSVPVMRGVYYRVGASRGTPIKTEHLVNEGTGTLAIASQAVYFLSSPRALKIPAKKIIAVEAFADGVSITRDTANAKPQFFKVDDPWFAVNAITRLNQL